jgi:hypothetical protein
MTSISPVAGQGPEPPSAQNAVAALDPVFLAGNPHRFRGVAIGLQLVVHRVPRYRDVPGITVQRGADEIVEEKRCG